MKKIKEMKNNKNFKAIFIAATMLLLCIGSSTAQDTLRSSNDSLVVYNIFASFNNVVKNNADPQNMDRLNDTITDFNIGFKVNSAGSISELYILIGLQKDSSDYQLIPLSVVKENGINFIYQNNSKISRFWKRDASYSMKIPTRDINRIKWITIYAIDRYGKFSKRNYFNVQ